MFVVTMKIEVDAEFQALFRNAVLMQSEVTLEREVGCLQYEVSFHPTRKTVCLTYQVYETRAAYDHHLMSEHYRTFDQITAPWIASREVELWQRHETRPQI